MGWGYNLTFDPNFQRDIQVYDFPRVFVHNSPLWFPKGSIFLNQERGTCLPVTSIFLRGEMLNFSFVNGKLMVWDSLDPHISGQITIFHQPRFPWNKGISRNLNYLLGEIGRVRSRFHLTKHIWKRLGFLGGPIRLKNPNAPIQTTKLPLVD